MAVSGSSQQTIIIDVTLNSQDASQRAKALADAIIALRDRQDILRVSGRQLGNEYRNNAIQIQQLERQVRSYNAIANQQNGSLNQLRAQLSLLTGQFDALSRSERENSNVGGQLTSQIQKLQKEISAAEQATGRFQRNVGNYTQGIQNYVSGFFSLASAIALVKKTFDTALETDATRTALGYILESTTQADAKIRTLKNTANDLGLEFVASAEAYQKFIGAAKASNFDLQEADRLFNSVSRVLGVLHVPAEGASRAFYALQEMISMGTVQSRQLNRMLGLVIPGASKIMADALGVTNAQLHEMQRSGELISNEVLPKFADQLDKAIAPGVDQIDSLQASFENLKNTFSESVDANSGIGHFFKTIIDGLTNISRIILGTFNDVTMGRWDAFISRLTNSDTADRIVRLQESLANSRKALNESIDFSTATPDQANNRLSVLTDVYKDARKAYEDYSNGVKDGTLKDTGNLQQYKNVMDAVYQQINQIKLVYPQVGKEVKKVTDLADDQLTSIKQIRERIADLQKLPGSAVADDAIYKRIKALQDRLKALRDNGNKEEENALKKIAEDRLKSVQVTSERLYTEREKEIGAINADIDKRVRMYKKYNQDTAQLEYERQVRIAQSTAKFHQQDLVTIRQNIQESQQIRLSLIGDADQKAFELAQFQNENAIAQTDRNIAALAARIALGEQGLTQVIQSEVEKRNALTDQGNQQRAERESAIREHIQQIQDDANAAAYQSQLDEFQREYDLIQQRLELNQQLTQSYGDLTGAISDLTGKNTTLGKIAFLAQKAFAIQQIILNSELTKSQIILRYEILKTQATLAASLAGPFAPFVASAANAALSAAQAAELAKATTQEVIQVGIVSATALAGVLGKEKGGIQYNSNGRGAILPGYSKKDNMNARLRDGEAVIVSEAARDPYTRQVLSDINVAYGGKAFANGGVYAGSYIQSSSAQIASQVYQNNLINDYFSKIKIYTSVTDINAGQAKYAQITDNANF